MTALEPIEVPRVAARPGVGRVAFITGCGRSGTTILGRLLSKHRDVTYLNDQFMLWASAFPEYEVCGWLPFSPGACPPLVLEAAAATEAGSRRFRAALEARRDGRLQIVEKLAVNSFRMAFVREIVPGCAFINIVRHGVEVAYSIEQRALKGRWWGPGDRKWHCLRTHARARGYGDLLELCTTDFYRGLLEWRMSVDAADEYIDRDRPDRFLRLRYEELIADPVAVCERLEAFLGLVRRPVMREFAARTIARRNAAAGERPWPEHAERIAGPALGRLGYSRAGGTP